MCWPDAVEEINYFCKADNSLQPAMMYGISGGKEKRPLLVGLHTWSYTCKQAGGESVYAKWCIQNDWLFIHPDFRGANNKPEAMGSEYAVSDIYDAVEYMKENFAVDTDRIYLIGASGGGHAAMLMAGKFPGIWAGVSAWCGISDIQKWWRQNKNRGGNYSDSIELCCGGNPEIDAVAAAECAGRSPLSYLKFAASVNLDINAGVNDGRQGSVPFSHSLYAFNEVAADEDKINETDIEDFYEKGDVPLCGGDAVSAALYGRRKPLFVKTSHNTRVVVFDGGHEIIHYAALNWLKQQRKGAPAVWLIDEPVEIAA